MKDYNEREQIKGYEANKIKERIMNDAYRLEEAGFKRDAKGLMRIAAMLEEWQHR